MDSIKGLSGKAAVEATATLGERMEQIRNADRMSLKDLEKLLDQHNFARGTPLDDDLRFVRYQKQGGTLGYEAVTPDRRQARPRPATCSGSRT
jgi:hypothetical protein